MKANKFENEDLVKVISGPHIGRMGRITRISLKGRSENIWESNTIINKKLDQLHYELDRYMYMVKFLKPTKNKKQNVQLNEKLLEGIPNCIDFIIS